MSRVSPFYVVFSLLLISSHCSRYRRKVPTQPAQQASTIVADGVPKPATSQSLQPVSPVALPPVPVHTESATLSSATQGQQIVAVPVPQAGAGTVVTPLAIQSSAQPATQPAVQAQSATRMAPIAAVGNSAAAATTPTSSAADAAAEAASEAAAAAQVAAAAAHSAASAASNASMAARVAASTSTDTTSWSATQWILVRIFQLAAGITFASAIKGLCIVGNVLVQLSPFPDVTCWEARGCTGDSDAAPYLSIAFGGCQWCFYGLFAWLVTSRSAFLVLVQSNLLGAALGPYYVLTFLKHCRRQESRDALQKYLSAISALVLLQVCGLCILPVERALFLTGLISSFCSFIGASSVLVTVPAVVRSKDSSSIPGLLAIASLCSAITWVVCGYIIQDPMVMMPNMFATCCSGLVVALKMLYPSSEDGDAQKGKLEQSEEFSMTTRMGVWIAPRKLGKLRLKKPTELTPIKPGTENLDMTILPEKWADVIVAAVNARSDGTGGTH